MPWTPEQRAEQCRQIAGAKSTKKAAASRENGKKGGRPRKNKPVDCGISIIVFREAVESDELCPGLKGNPLIELDDSTDDQ